MTKKIIALYLICFSLFSCERLPENKFYFSDGTEIKDTSELKFLNDELRKYETPNQKMEDVFVYTSLQKEFSEKTGKVLKDYNKTYWKELRKENKNQSKLIDSLNKLNRLFSLNVLVLNHVTGELVNLKSNNGYMSLMNVNKMQWVKPMGFLLAFEKGINLEDLYIAEDVNFPNNKRTTSLKNAYCLSYPIALSMPYKKYPKSAWGNLKERLELDLDLSHFTNDRWNSFSIDATILDVIKTFATISNNGSYRRPYFIKLIKNEKGKVIYKDKDVLKKNVIHSESNEKIKELLNLYMLGKGRVFYRNNIIENCYAVSVGGSSSLNFIVYSSEKYTIGIEIRRHNYAYSLRKKNTEECFSVLNEVLQILDCNKTKGEVYRKINQTEKEEEQIEL